MIHLHAKKVYSTFQEKEVCPVKEFHNDTVENVEFSVLAENCNSRTRHWENERDTYLMIFIYYNIDQRNLARNRVYEIIDGSQTS